MEILKIYKIDEMSINPSKGNNELKLLILSFAVIFIITSAILNCTVLAEHIQNNNFIFYQVLFVFTFFFYVLKFSSSSILLGGGKELLKYFPGIMVLKKNVMRKNIGHKKDKSEQDFSHASDNFHKTNVLLSQFSEDAKKHPIIMGIFVNGKAGFSLVTTNLTTSSNNSVILSKEGGFHDKPVYIYNHVLVEKIDSNNIIDIQQLVKNCKDHVYTKDIISNVASDNLNKFMVTKATEKTGENHEIYMPGATFEQKTNKLVDLFDDFKQMNSRED
jgi:hypothetical protein